MTIKEMPEVRIAGFSSKGIEWQILYWVGTYEEKFSVRHAVQRRVLRNMHYAGIEIPADRIDFSQTKLKEAIDYDNNNEDLLFIRTLPLFSSLTQSELDWLQQELKRVFFPKGEQAIQAGEQGDSLFIVQEGIFDVAIRDPDGEMVSVGHLIPGTFFGERSLLIDAPRSATVTAEVDSIAYELGREPISVLLHQRPQVMEELSLALAERQLQNSNFMNRATTAQIETEQSSLMSEFIEKIKRVFGFC
ncbi:MAG: cyclic nucleotide-binding domain-containing protein [Gammaproteobacteria bacterium]|jgi:CRP-like cAMP-binding protein|nr:cyclic nucleotide-binding domain-containing protein [Gammaproteobacteria bacterium]MBT7308754.1 cyclic nucleotide-binding domain-containing protein [Gammaproteobacteria bacterium]